LLLPPTVFFSLREDPRQLRKVAAAIALGGLVCIAIVCAGSAYEWLFDGRTSLRKYVFQRMVFVLVADPEYPYVDWPIVQLTLTAAVCWTIARFRKPAADRVVMREQTSTTDQTTPGSAVESPDLVSTEKH
jgi:hypothetical protein